MQCAFKRHEYGHTMADSKGRQPMKAIMNQTDRFVIRTANAEDRAMIYRLRHEVYARELGQHEMRPEGSLRDPLDAFNIYLVAEWRGEIAGFISITPPGCAQYSIDKYITRLELHFVF